MLLQLNLLLQWHVFLDISMYFQVFCVYPAIRLFQPLIQILKKYTALILIENMFMHYMIIVLKICSCHPQICKLTFLWCNDGSVQPSRSGKILRNDNARKPGGSGPDSCFTVIWWFITTSWYNYIVLHPLICHLF